MNTVNIYLNFLGECEEAFLFYQSIFGGEFSYFSRFKDMPAQEDMGEIPADKLDYILHVSLPISDETILMGSDLWNSDNSNFIKGNNFSVSLTAASVSEADRIFNALALDGKIEMPIANTFWGDYFGTVTDKFGIPWMVMCSN